MPIKILEEFGWDFDDKSDPRPTPDNMRWIYSTKPGNRIGMQQTPNFRRSGEKGKDQTVERTAKNFQGRIVENINRMRAAMEDDDGVLAVPADWGVSSISFGNGLFVKKIS